MACPSLAGRAQSGAILSSGFTAEPKDVTDWLETTLAASPHSWRVSTSGNNTDKRSLLLQPALSSPIASMQIGIAWDKGTGGSIAMEHGSPMTGTVAANSLVFGFAPFGGIANAAALLLSGNPTGSGVWRGWWRCISTTDALTIGKIDLWTSLEDIWIFFQCASSAGKFYWLNCGAQIEAYNPQSGVTSSDADGRVYLVGTSQDQNWVNAMYEDGSSCWGTGNQSANDGPRMDYYHPGLAAWRIAHPLVNVWNEGFFPYDMGENLVRMRLEMQDASGGKWLLGGLRNISMIDTRFGARVTLDDSTFVGRGMAPTNNLGGTGASNNGLLSNAT